MFSLLCTDSQLSNSELAALQRPVPVFCSPLLSPPFLSSPLGKQRSFLGLLPLFPASLFNCSPEPGRKWPLLTPSVLQWPLDSEGSSASMATHGPLLVLFVLAIAASNSFEVWNFLSFSKSGLVQTGLSHQQWYYDENCHNQDGFYHPEVVPSLVVHVKPVLKGGGDARRETSASSQPRCVPQFYGDSQQDLQQQVAILTLSNRGMGIAMSSLPLSL